MSASWKSRGIGQNLVRASLWFCACNLLAAALAAQCPSPVITIPDQTVTSGSPIASSNTSLRAANYTVSGSASVTFASGQCIELAPNFHATAGTAPTTFHAWVDTLPTVSPASPQNGFGASGQVTWTASSPPTYGSLATLVGDIGTSFTTVNSCFVIFNAYSNVLQLADNGGYFPPANSMIVPGAGVIGNSQCTIYGGGSSVSRSGNQLALTLFVTFQPAYAGLRNQYLQAIDRTGLSSEIQQVGTWTVPGSQQQYYLTTAVSPLGAGTISPPSGWYNSGAVITVSATANSGYQFSGFTGDLSGTMNPQTLAINGPKSVTATFTQSASQYYLTTAVSPPGAGTISPPSGWYNSGAVVTVSATANSGYQFSGFTGDLSGTTNPQNLTINGPKSATATFTQSASPVTITTASPLPGGAWGVPYSPVTLAATGGAPPYSWSMSDPPIDGNVLPSGLSLSAGGVLSGTPTRGGQTYGFWIRVTDSLGATATKTFTLAIGPAVQPISGPSRLEVGLSYMPFDEYDFDHPASSKFLRSCPAGSSIRSCFQTVLAELRAQGVSGVRIFFTLCGPDSTPLVNCGQNWTQVRYKGNLSPPDLTWINRVKDFFGDVRNAGIQNITLTLAHHAGAPYSKPKSQVSSPKGGPETLCADAPDTIYFYPGVPLGYKDVGNNEYYPIGQELPDNTGYNCAPINPFFVGWQNQYDVIDAMLAAAAEKQLTVSELDFEQELNIMLFPALARFIVDNAQGDSGQPNVRNALRYYMTLRGFDAGRVTWSAPWSNSTTAANEENIAKVNCTSVYAGYARTMGADQIAAAIGGGLIGRPREPNPDWGPETGYLMCNGSTEGMFQMPDYGSQPNILDVHLRPCVAPLTGSHCLLGDAEAAVRSEAKIDFDDIVNYIARFPSTATVMLGETHSNCDHGGTLCEGGTLNAPAETVAGFNDSRLAGRSVVFRPWMQLQHPGDEYYTYPGNQRVNFQGSGPYTPTQQ